MGSGGGGSKVDLRDETKCMFVTVPSCLTNPALGYHTMPGVSNPARKCVPRAGAYALGVVQLPASTVSASTTCELSPHVLHPSAPCVLGAWACASTAFFLWPEARPVTCGASRHCTSFRHPRGQRVGYSSALAPTKFSLRAEPRPIFPRRGWGLADSIASAGPRGVSLCVCGGSKPTAD